MSATPVSVTTAPGRLRTEDARLPYLPGLDGLRALAVVAVLLYHAGLSWMPGGFLGVEVFFVLSGYLITLLLLAEWSQHGRIDLLAFWQRRARRLLPATLLLLIVTLALATLFLPDEVAQLRGDTLAALGYVTNWHLIFDQKSYFETVGRPSLLQHLWSLAVEGQFYLLWPLLFAAAMRRWRFRYVLIAVLAGAVASTMLMALGYQPDVDPSRLYYGSDTRAAGFLIGAALAFVIPPGFLPPRIGRKVALQLDLLGLAMLGALVGCFLWCHEYQPFLYQGGFAVVALTTAILIAVILHPCSFIGWGVLDWGPLRWVGQRSYSIYLWHWPVFMLTRPQIDIPIDGMPLLVLRLVLTGMLADLSYRHVETPFRAGAVGRAWNELRMAQGLRRWWLGVQWAGVTTGIAVCVVALGVAVADAQPPPRPAYLAVESIRFTSASVNSTPTPGVLNTPTPPPVVAPLFGPPAAAGPEPIAPPTTAALFLRELPATPTPTPEPVVRVTAIGDSVMVGAGQELANTIANLDIDAAVSRQAAAAIDILRARRDAGQLGDVVVVHIGSNGYFSPQQFDEMMQIVAGVRNVLIMNVKVPRQWEGPNNGMLAEGVSRYPNAALVDWYAASVNRPEIFRNDGYHLQPEGARLYAEVIAAALAQART